jgi:predicted transcriptional regulator
VVKRHPPFEAGAVAESAHTLAANLRRLREDAGLSQEALAHAADLHPNAIGLLERGQRDPQLSTLLALVRALDAASTETVTIADLTADLT